MTTINVPGRADPVEMLEADAIKEMVNSNDTALRKSVVEHLKALGVPVTEIVRMSAADRETTILAKYKEFGGKGGVKKTAAAATTAAKAGVTKTAVKTAAKTKEPEPEVEAEEPAVSFDTSALEAQVAELGGKVDTLTEIIQTLASFILDTHFVARAQLALAGQEDDAKSLKDEYHSKLLIDEEGNV